MQLSPTPRHPPLELRVLAALRSHDPGEPRAAGSDPTASPLITQMSNI